MVYREDPLRDKCVRTYPITLSDAMVTFWDSVARDLKALCYYYKHTSEIL